jgi:hypothetical protein
MPKHCESFQELVITELLESITAQFEFDPKKFLIKNVCGVKHADCVIKITGVIRGSDGQPLNFIAVVKFTISLSESGLEAKLININICDIVLVAKYDEAPTSCGDFKIYYNINDLDCNSSSDIIDDAAELVVYEVIEAAFAAAVLDFNPDVLKVVIAFQTVTLPHLTSLIGGVIVGCQNPCNKKFNKYSITGCCKCEKPVVPCFPCSKIITIFLKILMFIIILLILDPCCKYIVPKQLCFIKKLFLKKK